MNSAFSAGLALTVLGLAGVISTGAATAVIPAVFGLILLGLGALMGRPGRARQASWAALGVGLIGCLAALGNVARVAASGGLALNAATFANTAMALICAAFVGLWILERRGSRPDNAAG